MMGFWKSLRLLWDFTFRKPKDSAPREAYPVAPLTREALLAAPDQSIHRLGHSTILLKLRGRFWITDPVFAERAFALQWMGPKRFHESPRVS